MSKLSNSRVKTKPFFQPSIFISVLSKFTSSAIFPRFASTKNHIRMRYFPPDKFKAFQKPIEPARKLVLPETLLPTCFETKSNWTKNKFRTGVIAIKMGNISFWDQHGVHHACTVVRIDNLQVVALPPHENKQGRFGMMLGCGQKNWNRVDPSQRILCETAGVPYKAHFREFRVSPDALLPIGTPIFARHFLPGQLVDAKAKTIGKGFQGTIKRHNFKRQPKTHGATKVHRKPGSQGNKGHARVYPGKKGAGRMGGKFATILNLKIMKIDQVRDVLYIKGDIPGKPGTFVYLRDALYKPSKIPLPYPTFVPNPYEKPEPELLAPLSSVLDPFVENKSTPKTKSIKKEK